MNRDHTFSADSRDGFDSFTPSADDWQEWLDYQADNLHWPEPEWDEDESEWGFEDEDSSWAWAEDLMP